MPANPPVRTVAAWTLAAALLVVSAGLFVGPATAQADTVTRTGENVTVPESVVSSDRPDPPSDRLGWENGVWANATLSVTQADGINETELQAVVARTMARTEQVREVEFTRTPPVRIITPSQQREQAGEFVDPSKTERIALNTQYEALFIINESTDAVDSRRALVGGAVSGYYDPTTRNVTMLALNESTLVIRENILAQELFHAQQDNRERFNISTADTYDEDLAHTSVVEGDANYVQTLYERRCAEDGVWDDTCYIVPRSGASESPANLNLGMFQTFLQPYNSGVALVRERHQQQGWDAVTALYENPPVSTEQVIHPEKYPEETPANLTVTDRSTDAWTPLAGDRARETVTVGEAGLFVSLVYPAIDSQRQTQVIPLFDHVVGGVSDPVTYAYDHPLTAGWNGDTLLPYVSTDTNETAYVYELAWDSPADAEEFLSGYRQVLEYHDAEAVSGRIGTYRIPESDGFTDAVYVNRTGRRITVVNAPTVGALSAVRQGAAPRADTPATDTRTTGSSTATDAGTGGSSTTTPAGGEPTDSTTSRGAPGMGVVVAALALAALAAGALVRR